MSGVVPEVETFTQDGWTERISLTVAQSPWALAYFVRGKDEQWDRVAS